MIDKQKSHFFVNSKTDRLDHLNDQKRNKYCDFEFEF